MPSDSSSRGPTPPGDGQDPHRQTHTSHTINIPYRPTFHPKPEEAPKEPPKVTPIPRITSPTSENSSSPSAHGLDGKYVDEFGNILDWNGTVLGRVEGDLPSMVGRPVSKTGEVFDADGEVAGYVSENYTTKPPLKELDGGLRVDDAGNIYNQDGAVIGKLNEPPKHEKSSSEHQNSSSGPQHDSSSAPKPSAAPNPSEIYLDVKSTFEGIQLIIKIPTVFNRDKEDESKS